MLLFGNYCILGQLIKYFITLIFIKNEKQILICVLF